MFTQPTDTVIDDISDDIDDVADLIDGDWQYDTGARKVLYGGSSGKIYIPSTNHVKADASAIALEVETFEFDFDALFQYKEIDKLIAFYSGGGAPVLNLLVGTRTNRLESVSWSAAQSIANQLSGESAFFIRNLARGKLIRFKFQCDNSNTNYITEITKISFDKHEPDSPEK